MLLLRERAEPRLWEARPPRDADGREGERVPRVADPPRDGLGAERIPDGRLRVAPLLVVPRGALDLGRGCAAGARRRLLGEALCVRKPERLERVVVPELGVRKVRFGVARSVRLRDRFAGRPVAVGVRKVRGVVTRSERVLERVAGRAVVAAGARGVRVGVARSLRFPDRLPVVVGVRKVRALSWLAVRSCDPLLVVALRIELDGLRVDVAAERPVLNLRAAARSVFPVIPVMLPRRITFVFARPTSSRARCKLASGEAVRARALGVRAVRRITPRGRCRVPRAFPRASSA